MELEKRALARALGAFRGSSTWMSRIRVKRVAHAVPWGDGLRFLRVRDGRLPYYLPSTHSILGSLPLCVCVVHRQARLHGPAVLLGSLAWRRRGVAANQDISLASDTRASAGAWASQGTGVHQVQHVRAHTSHHVQSPFLRSVRPAWVELAQSVSQSASRPPKLQARDIAS